LRLQIILHQYHGQHQTAINYPQSQPKSTNPLQQRQTPKKTEACLLPFLSMRLTQTHLFSTTHSIDEDECYRTPRMVDGSKDLSPDNQDGNPVRPMNMPCTR